LKHLKDQGKLNCQHTRWVEFTETFSYVINCKQSEENIVTDVLLQRHLLLSTINTKLLGFEYVKDLYIEDFDFGQVYIVCEHSTFDKFYRFDEYLFKEKSCVCLIVLCMNC